MELMRYWQILRRWWWLLALGVLAAGIAGGLVSSRTTPTYRASARILVDQVEIPGLGSPQDGLASERLKTYSELLRSRSIIVETIKQLDLPTTADALSERVTVRPIRDTQLLELVVEDTDPARAALTANRLAEVFIAQNRALRAGGGEEARRQVDLELADLRQKIDTNSRRLGQLRATPTTAGDPGEADRVQSELTQYRELYFRLLETQQRMALSQAQATSSITVIDPARPPTAPFRPRTVQSTILAAVLGLLLAGGVALLIEYFDDRLRDPEELRQRFGLAPLSILRLDKGKAAKMLLNVKLNEDHHFAEALRLLRTNLEFVTAKHPPVIVISSAVPGEGKSTVAANLAITEAQANKRVVLIDADLRKPMQHRLFGLGNHQGLSTFLAYPEADIASLTRIGPLGIRVLTSGPIPPNPSELLGSRRMATLMTDLRAQADMIIIDSVPILPVADTLVLQRHVDGVVLVMDVRHTGTRTLERALRSLQQVPANVLGVVLNKDKRRLGSYYYGYRHRPEQELETRGGDGIETTARESAF